MNRENFYVGLGMLGLPLLFFLIYRIIELQTTIHWDIVGLVFLGLTYFGTALFLIIKGALSDN